MVILVPVVFFLTWYYWPEKDQFAHHVCGVPSTRINEFSLYPDSKLVSYYPWRWSIKQLKVYFKDLSDAQLVKRLLDQANKWTPFTKLSFVRTYEEVESNIRIAFMEGHGYQSVIGSLADTAKKNADFGTTMWLERLDTVSQSVFNRVVLHEFGHAIGLLHELQSKNSPIEWDSSAVYRYFDSAYHWSETVVNQNILTPVAYADATLFDPHSIMIYAVPAFLMKNHASIPWPAGLSGDDKTKIKVLYP